MDLFSLSPIEVHTDLSNADNLIASDVLAEVHTNLQLLL